MVRVMIDWGQIERVGHAGPEGRVARFDHLVPQILSKYQGNIVEIGAGFGDSTLVFLKYARAFGRKVLVIDPWPPKGTAPAGYDVYSYDTFCAVTEPYKEDLIVCRKPSSDPSVEQYVADVAPIAFAFIDGLQYKENVLQDLDLIVKYSPSIVCVDDWERNTPVSQVPLAMSEFFDTNDKYAPVPRSVNNIEGYLYRI